MARSTPGAVPTTPPRIGRLRAALGVGAALLATLLLLGPTTGGVAPGTTVISAPFHGTFTKSHWGTTAGCGHWLIMPKAHWNDTAGRAAWKISTAASYCSSTSTMASARASLHAVLLIPLPVPGGTHSIFVNGSATYVYHYALHLGGLCPAPILNRTGYGSMSCRIESFVFLHPAAVLVDQTTGLPLAASAQSAPNLSRDNNRFVATVCAAFACSSQHGSHGLTNDSSAGQLWLSWRFNGSFNGSHAYVLRFDFQSGALSEVYGYPSSAAHSTLNFAGWGRDGFVLAPITIA